MPMTHIQRIEVALRQYGPQANAAWQALRARAESICSSGLQADHPSIRFFQGILRHIENRMQQRIREEDLIMEIQNLQGLWEENFRLLNLLASAERHASQHALWAQYIDNLRARVASIESGASMTVPQLQNMNDRYAAMVTDVTGEAPMRFRPMQAPMQSTLPTTPMPELQTTLMTMITGLFRMMIQCLSQVLRPFLGAQGAQQMDTFCQGATNAFTQHFAAPTISETPSLTPQFAQFRQTPVARHSHVGAEPVAGHRQSYRQ